MDFPGGAVVKNLPANAGDMGLILVRELRSRKPHGVAKRKKKEREIMNKKLATHIIIKHPKYQ